jgi:selenocysteine lyase/cysteine desulfurase
MNPAIDTAALRARTPGTGGAHHLNAAGAAIPTEQTVARIVEHLELEARIGGYEAAAQARPLLDAVYDSAAAMLGADPEEIALAESATVAWRRALAALRLRAGDRVVLSHSTYVSCALHLLALERERGILLEVLPCGDDGAVDLGALAGALQRPAKLLVLSHVPTTSGLVEPVERAGALARDAGVTFALDATQSVGQLPVDVRTIGCDIAFTTGRKFLRGPRGTGILYVRAGLGLEPYAPDVRGADWVGDREWRTSTDARRFETWEAAHALRLGLGNALDEALALGPTAIAAHLVPMAAGLRAALANVPGVAIADPPRSPSAIVTFNVKGTSAGTVAARLGDRRVHVVAVPAGHGRWDLGARGLDEIVRASPHVHNDRSDLEALIDGVASLATPVRRGV